MRDYTYKKENIMASWNILIKKNYLNASHKPQSTKGIISINEERQLESVHKDLVKLEENIKKLYKSVKKCHDHLLSLYKYEDKISSSMVNNPLCNDEPQLKEAADAYQKTVYQQGKLSEDFSLITEQTVLKSLKILQNEFEFVANAIKKRDNSLTECLKHQSKLEKLEKTDSGSSNTTGQQIKLEQARAASKISKEEFLKENNILMTELVEFYNIRHEFLRPGLQAFARAQADYYAESSRLYSLMLTIVDPEGEIELADSQETDDNFNSLIDQLKALGIVDATNLQ